MKGFILLPQTGFLCPALIGYFVFPENNYAFHPKIIRLYSFSFALHFVVNCPVFPTNKTSG